MAYGTCAQCMTQIRTHIFNSLTCVCLQSAFEGTFKLWTSIFPALISPDIDAVDPTGHGRRRIVNVKMVYGDATWVFWDMEEAQLERQMWAMDSTYVP